MSQHSRKVVATALLVALAYLATGRVGLMIPAIGSNVTLLWLPAGIAVAALFRWGLGCAGGVALGALVVNLAVGTPWAAALGIAVGNTLGPLLATWVLRRTGFRPTFERDRDLGLLALAAALGMLVTSTLGVATLVGAGLLPPGARGHAMLLWWAGDTLGVVVAAPAVLTVSRAGLRLLVGRRVEFASWLAASTIAAWAVFVLNRGDDGPPLSVAFLPLPFVAWAALRFNAAITSLGMVLVTAIAAYGTATERGPFFSGSPTRDAVSLWLFMAAAAVLGWLISALHATQRRAAGAQRRLDQALCDVSLGVLLTGADRRITYANEGFTRLTGYTEAEMLGRSCALLQGPGTDPDTVARLRAALHAGRAFDGEILNYRKDGAAFWNGLSISPVHDEHGVMNGFLGIQRDITAAKQAAAQHERTVATMQLFLDTVEAYASFVDSEERYQLVNRRYQVFFGLPAAQIIGRRMSEIQTADGYAQMRPHVRAALAGQDVRFRSRVTDAGGAEHWLDVQYAPRREPDGAVSGFFALVFDVTASTLAELALEDSRSRLDGILNAIEDVVWSATPDGRTLQFVSASAQAVYGCPAADFVAEPTKWLAMIHPEDRDATARARDRLAESGTYDAEYRIIRGDGAVRWLHDRGRFVTDADGRPLRLDGIATDVTDRREAVAALQQRERQFRALADNLPDVVARFDRNRRHLFINPAAEAATGFAPEAFLGKTNEELGMPIETTAVWRESLEQLFATGAAQRFEFAYPGPTGRVTWESHVVAERAASGEVESALVVSRDITERKRAEVRNAGELAVLDLVAARAPLDQVLERLAASFEQMFPGLRCALQALDRDGRPLGHAMAPGLPAALRGAMAQLDPERAPDPDLTVAATDHLATVEDIATAPRWQRVRDLALASGLLACWSVPLVSSDQHVLGRFDVFPREGQALRPDEVAGLERSARFAALAIERHHLVRSLELSERRFRTLTEHAPMLIYLADVRGACVYVNRRWCEATGLTPEEARGQGWLDGVDEDDRATIGEAWRRSVASDGEWGFEYRLKNRAGVVTWVYGTAARITAADGTPVGFVGTNVDITGRRQAEADRAALDRKLLETQKLESLGVLAGGIAHDFNNLLTSILGNASLATMDLPPGSPVHESIEQITEASVRAADLCRQMLAYSGRGRFVVQRLDLGQLVEQTTQMLQLSISKKAELRFRLERGLPPVEVDATQLRQVVMNLVINASEAIGDASGIITLSTGPARVDRAYLQGNLMDPELQDGDYVYLEVSDTGSGMSVETQAKIFDPFFTTKFTGRGLGLAAVLGIVRGHKGALKVSSAEARGTTFRLLFPAAGGPALPAEPASGPAPVWRGQGTVLVVDDEEGVRTTVARLMRHLGLEAVVAAGGRAAVELFRAAPASFALVMLDLSMPDLDGEQTFAELRQIMPEVRVVLMSGYDAQDAVDRFHGKGLAAFVQKPFSVGAIQSVLQSVLRPSGAG